MYYWIEMSQKHIEVHRKTNIPYNNLLRWGRGEHTPEIKFLEQIQESGCDPTPYAKPVIEKYSKFIVDSSESGETSAACSNHNAKQASA
jgi:hypothetical protein